MTAPLIGLTTYGRQEDGKYYLPAEYVDCVRRAGGLPLLLPPGPSDVEGWLALVDGLILTGGGDIDARRYGGGGSKQNYKVDAERDGCELESARKMLASRLPALCICRGTQVLNVALGGTLIEHLPDVVGEQVLHRDADTEPISHAVNVSQDSALAKQLGTESVAPLSWHHQAVGELGDGVHVVATAPDGVIEAIEIEGHPQVLAVQWHPELTAATDSTQQGLFNWLVREASRRKI
ncbi:MAG: putative glutamine amidotransferase [Planctomycetota bacterium]|jgi:putative glutamine amidotransferase